MSPPPIPVDARTRQERARYVDELRDLVAAGRYRVAPELVADAVAEAWRGFLGHRGESQGA